MVDIFAKADNPPPATYKLSVLERGVTGVAPTPDGKLIVIALADKNNSVWVWDFMKDMIVARLEGHEEKVLCVAVFPDGRRILTGSADRTARVWPLSTEN